MKITPGIIFILLLLSSCATISPAGHEPRKAYTNPVLIEAVSIPHSMGIGDPAVIYFEGKYYLYPTGDNLGYDVYISDDLVHWGKGPRVFRSGESGVWAPDVFQNPSDGKFYLYYTVDGLIGVAVSDRPDGTFTDLGPLVEYAIDANMFLDDDGRCYLYYAAYPDFGIYVQPMKNGVEMEGSPLLLIQPDQPWERRGRPISEAPWMLKHKGTYYLLYSGGGANTEDYAIGYATSMSPLGPFVKYPANPIMKKGCGIYGPGHCSVVRTPQEELWMVYHQKTDSEKNWNRIICIDQIWFDYQGILHVDATRGTAQPAPLTR